MKAILLPLILMFPLISHADARFWTNQEGRNFKGEFISSDGQEVTVRRIEDRKKFTIPVEDLSKQDQEYIRSMLNKNQPSSFSDRSKSDPLLTVRSEREILASNDPAYLEHDIDVEIHEETGILTYKRMWGKSNVIFVHPFGNEIPGLVDFSKVTNSTKGKLKLYVRNHPKGDHYIKIIKSGRLYKYEAVSGDDWQFYRVEYDNEPILLEIHATGWYYEHSYITYKIEH